MSDDILINGQSHKDVYINGYSHKEAWLNGKCIWEKGGGVLHFGSDVFELTSNRENANGYDGLFSRYNSSASGNVFLSNINNPKGIFYAYVCTSKEDRNFSRNITVYSSADKQYYSIPCTFIFPGSVGTVEEYINSPEGFVKNNIYNFDIATRRYNDICAITAEDWGSFFSGIKFDSVSNMVFYIDGTPIYSNGSSTNLSSVTGHRSSIYFRLARANGIAIDLISTRSAPVIFINNNRYTGSISNFSSYLTKTFFIPYANNSNRLLWNSYQYSKTTDYQPAAPTPTPTIKYNYFVGDSEKYTISEKDPDGNTLYTFLLQDLVDMYCTYENNNYKIQKIQSLSISSRVFAFQEIAFYIVHFGYLSKNNQSLTADIVLGTSYPNNAGVYDPSFIQIEPWSYNNCDFYRYARPVYIDNGNSLEEISFDLLAFEAGGYTTSNNLYRRVYVRINPTSKKYAAYGGDTTGHYIIDNISPPVGQDIKVINVSVNWRSEKYSLVDCIRQGLSLFYYKTYKASLIVGNPLLEDTDHQTHSVLTTVKISDSINSYSFTKILDKISHSMNYSILYYIQGLDLLPGYSGMKDEDKYYYTTYCFATDDWIGSFVVKFQKAKRT